MKTLISFIAALLYTLSANIVNAKESPLKYKDNKHIVGHYVDAITKGQVEHIDYLFENNFQLEVFNAGRADKFSKEQLLTFLKSTEGLNLYCHSSYTIIDASKDYTLAKVEMKFDTFTRVDYVTLLNKEEGWKINKVITTYP